MAYQFDWSVISDPLFWLRAISITLVYAVGTVIAGLAIGVLGGAAMISRFRVLRVAVSAYVQVFRCTPLVVQIVWFFYALPMLTGYALPEWLAAGAGLTLYMGAFATEIFRAGVTSIERGQWDAAQALGLKYRQMMGLVILPQAIRRMMPALVSQSILQLKNTSLLYVVAVPDLMYSASQVTARTYRPLELYTFVAAIYFLLLFPLTMFSKKLETRADL
jgi:polar amino acid transport system permease protein